MFQNDTARKLQELMDAKGWSLYRLAVESDVPYSSINNLFKRNTEPTLPTLRSLCKGLGISLSDFFSDEPAAETMDFTSEERELITQYRSMRRSDKRRIRSYFAAIQENLSDKGNNK